jgi:hypothetical protein
MDVSVMLEQVGNNGYRASTCSPAPFVAEAATRDEAVGKIRDMLCQKLSGVEMIELPIPCQSQPDPWMAFAGIWRDHPDAAEIEQNIRDYRRDVDADPERL